MQNHWETYCYVDAYRQDPESGKASPWIRCHRSNLQRFVVEPGQAIDCFTSVQNYRDASRDAGAEVSTSAAARAETPPAPAPTVGELPTSPPKTNGHHHPPAEAAHTGQADPPPFDLPQRQHHYHGLFFDFDVPKARRQLPRTDTLPQVQNDALRLAQFFLDGLEVSPAMVQVWFSGSKGFHLLVRPEVFELEPHAQLTYCVKQIATELRAKLGLESLDLSIYTISRMWRVENTLHSRSGLYKIELTVNELAQLSTEQILSLAQEPRYA